MVLLIIFGFVAGAATAVSPCVVPVLPIALSAGVTGGRRRPLGVVTGLVVAPYTTLAVALAIVGRTSQVTPSVAWTVVAAVLTGSLAAGTGVARGCGIGRELWARVPRDVRIGAGAAAAGGAVLQRPLVNLAKLRE